MKKADCPALLVDAKLHRYLQGTRPRSVLHHDGVPVTPNGEAGGIRVKLRSGRHSRRTGIGGHGEPRTRVLDYGPPAQLAPALVHDLDGHHARGRAAYRGGVEEAVRGYVEHRSKCAAAE